MSPFGFFAAAGAVTALLWLKSRHRQMGMGENEFWIAMWLIVGGVVVGAKTLFVVLGWHHYASGELRLFADFGTGFVFFGGLLGGVGAGAIFAWARGLNYWRGADYFAVALPCGHAIGRVGCFFNGCCGGLPPHPVQLYEATGLLLVAMVGHRAVRKVEAGEARYGTAFSVYVLSYALLRFALDPLRADGRPERFLGLSHQQGIALALALAAGVFFWGLSRRPRGTESADIGDFSAR